MIFVESMSPSHPKSNQCRALLKYSKRIYCRPDFDDKQYYVLSRPTPTSDGSTRPEHGGRRTEGRVDGKGYHGRATGHYCTSGSCRFGSESWSCRWCSGRCGCPEGYVVHCSKVHTWSLRISLRLLGVSGVPGRSNTNRVSLRRT